MFTTLWTRALGLSRTAEVTAVSVHWGAEWATRFPLALVLGLAMLVTAAVWFYRRLQTAGSPRVRLGLGIARGVVLGLLLLGLAEPTAVLQIVEQPRPLVWLLFDGTESMAIADDLPSAQQARLMEATGLTGVESAPRSASGTATTEPTPPARIDYLRALVQRADQNLLERLAAQFRIKAFLFERPDAVRALDSRAQLEDFDSDEEQVDPATLAAQLTTRGASTALGGALADLLRRHHSQQLAAIVVFSDFDQNAGPAPLAAAQQLDVPLYTVGIGPAVAVDLAVELDAPLLMKKGEVATLTVSLRQTDLDGATVPVRLTARRIDTSAAEAVVVGQRNVSLSDRLVAVTIPFTPQETGRWMFTASVEPQDGEVLRENNAAHREVNIQDDFLRLLYVEYEPTWEWRFIKEVFHRDRLVGQRGFRTFLRSADPKVRKANELFLTTLTPSRQEFFAYDVIFLGDLPASALSRRFTESVQEFVGQFGGGLVVLSGPTFGPGQLQGTPLAEMLPVVVDPDARLRDAREFVPRLTPDAARYDFMQLAAGAVENQRAWSTLGRLPWYQPVMRLRDGASLLLAHPNDRCADGKTPQPIVAVRQYGKGQVIFLATNETWRLRRKHGEELYRRFWGQMIYRLGLSHALGEQKRFVVRTDRQQYQVDDRVVVTVDAFDQNFEPLADDKLPNRKLTGRLLPAGDTAAADPALAATSSISLAEVRPGVYETTLTALQAGPQRVEISDPVTNTAVSANFRVVDQSLERRSAVRNVAIQEQLASATGGATYDLTSVDQLPDEIRAHAKPETIVETVPLWTTWVAFGLVAGLLLVEWTVRKGIHLP